MSNFLIILLVLGICLFLTGYFIFLASIYYRHIRNKGYTNPLLALAFAVTIPFALLVGVLALALSHHFDDTAYVALLMGGPVVLATIGLYVGAWMLPRKTRIAGARKIVFPYRSAGWVLLAGGVAQLLFFGFSSGWKTQTLSTSGKLLFWGALPGFFYCLYLARRAAAPSAADVFEADPRPPVLYLRAFIIEEMPFVYMGNSEASKYTSYLGTKTGVTLEQYFGNTIRQRIGPFVALGNPLDYAPPEGAARAYERDENWKERFLDLARRSACIIIQVGESRNLQWEFEALKQQGFHEKVFILTSPKLPHSSWNRLEKKILTWGLRVKGQKPPVWSEFAAGLCSAGYTIGASEPSSGSVLSFTPEASAILLATEAQAPSDFVDVLVDHLQTKVA
jgi:hypothetical protein